MTRIWVPKSRCNYTCLSFYIMMRENKQIIDDFKNEIDILYMYAMENTMSAKDIAGNLF